jgi:hypothetical protein
LSNKATFGVTPIAVKRAVKKYREEGPGGFYAERRVRGAAVLLPDMVEKAEDLLAHSGNRSGESARNWGGHVAQGDQDRTGSGQKNNRRSHMN